MSDDLWLIDATRWRMSFRRPLEIPIDVDYRIPSWVFYSGKMSLPKVTDHYCIIGINDQEPLWYRLLGRILIVGKRNPWMLAARWT